MKRYLVIINLFLIGIVTKANNLPFVSWENVPGNPTPDQLIGYLKSAASGQAIDGATVNAKPSDYEAVWGSSLYQSVLNAPVSSFCFGLSQGGERNNGISPNGVAVGGTLKPGVRVIFFVDNGKKIAIAKWGFNGCLNPLGEIQPKAAGPDIDEQTSSANSQPSVNNQQVTIVNPQISWDQGKNIYDQGRDQRELDMYHDADLFTKIQQSGNSQQPSTVGASTVVYTQAPVQNVPYQEPVYTQQRSNFWGDVAGTAVGSFVGTYLGNRLGNRNYGYSYYPQQTYQYRGGGRRGNYGNSGRVYNTTPLNPYGSVVTNPVVRRYNTSQLNGILGGNQGGQGYGNGSGYNYHPL
ncbi:MAG TPA: hypothetical protein VG621_01100 [Candidatus Paceibacterota bacterium]|nr:hypothetical protein [Candidatus Paceibacterota bacterium]